MGSYSMDKLDELLGPAVKTEPQRDRNEIITELMWHKEALTFAKEIILTRLYNKDEAAKIINQIERLKSGQK